MVEQTTLHNILTCVIAVVIFIFQSLNYIIARIKQYAKHKEKSATVETADTTISVAKPNDNITSESFIAAHELIQRHFDIPLIVAEDDPKVNNLIENTVTSDFNTASKDEYDQFMDHLIDDSYVARGLGLITATIGREAQFYLYSKYDNDFDGIVIELRGRNGESGEITITSKNSVSPIESKPIPVEYVYDEDRIKVFYTVFTEGVHTLTLSRNNIPICRSPYYISVEKSPANSRSRIRLGTKKYRMVTKFGKGKHTPVETKDNTVPIAEPSKSTVKSNTLPMAEESTPRTDVMSIITQFESKNKGVKTKVQKRLTSINEKNLENDTSRETSTSTDKQPNIETSPKKLNTYDNVLNICKINSRFKITDTKCSNSIDINHENNKQVDTKNTVDINCEEKNKFTAKLDENVETTNDILQTENVSLSNQKDSVGVLDDKTDNGKSSRIEKHNETFSTNELLEKRDNETVSANLVGIQSKIKSAYDEENIKNDVLHSDCDSEKPIGIIENTNGLKSNPNDDTVQQTTDPTQYNINTLSANTIKKITNSLCEKCSKQVIGILAELPRDINIKYSENSDEGHSNFETLLSQPIRININIDNIFKNAIDTNTYESSPHLQTNKTKKIETLDKNYNDMKCLSSSEKGLLKNDFKELNINDVNAELVIEETECNDEVNQTLDEKIPDKVTIPLPEHNIKIDKEVHQENKLSENETILKTFSANEEEESINSNVINTNTIHKQDNEVELQVQDTLKYIEQNLESIKSSDCDTRKNLEHLSEKYAVTLETNDLLIIDGNQNINETPDGDKSKLIIEQETNLEENSNFQSNTINDTVLTPINVISTNEEYIELDHGQQIKQLKTITTHVKDYKLMIEKSFEPLLNSFKSDIIEKMLQLCLNKDFSNDNHTKIIENTTNDTNNIKVTELNIENEKMTNNDGEIQIIQEKHEKKVSEKILCEEKTNSHHFLEQIEKIIKKNIASIDTTTTVETKLQQIVNATIHNLNDSQKNTLDNDTISEEIIDTPPTLPETLRPNFINTTIEDDLKHVKLKQNNYNQVEECMEDFSNEKSNILLVDNEFKSQIADENETLSSPIIENKHEILTDIETTPEKNTTVIEPETTSILQVLNKSETIEECTAFKVKSNVQLSKSIENSTESPPISEPSMTNDSEEKTSIPEKIDDTVENLTSNNIETLIKNPDKSDNNITSLTQPFENAKNIINSDSNTLQTETFNANVGDTNNLESVNIIGNMKTGEEEIIDETKQLNVDVTLNITDFLEEETSSTADLKNTMLNVMTLAEKKSNEIELTAQLDQSKPCDEEKTTGNISENTRELDTKSKIRKLSDTNTISENDINTNEAEKIRIKETKENNYIEDVQHNIDVVNIRYDSITNGIITSVYPKLNVEQPKNTKKAPELNYINITMIAKSRTINIKITTKPEISNENNSKVVKSEKQDNISTTLTTEDKLNDNQNDLEINTHFDSLLDQPSKTKVESKFEIPEIESVQAILPKKILQNETENQLENETIDLNNELTNDEENISTELVTDIPISKDYQTITLVESQETKTETVSEILNFEELQLVSMEDKIMADEDTSLVSIQSKNEQVPSVEELFQIQTENKLENNQDDHDIVTTGTSQNTDVEINTIISASKSDDTLSMEETVKPAKTLVQDIKQNEMINETNIEIFDQKTVIINTLKPIDTEILTDNQESQVEQNISLQEILIPEKHTSESNKFANADSSESKIPSVDQLLKTKLEPLSIDLSSNKLPALPGETLKKEDEIILQSHNKHDIEDISKQEILEKETTKNELAEPKTINTELKVNVQEKKLETEDTLQPENLKSKVSSDTTSSENSKCSLVEETIHKELEIDKSKSGDENKTPIENPIQLAIQITKIIPATNTVDNTELEKPIITQIEPLSLIPDETELTSDMVDEKNSVVFRASEDVRPIEENNQDEIISLNIESLKENSSEAVDTETSINITDKQTDEITTTEKSVEPTTALVEETNQSESTKHLEIKLVDPETIVIEITEQIDVQTVTDSQESQDEQTMTVKESMEPDSVTLLDSNESEIITREEPLSVNDDSSSLILNSKKLPATSIEDKTKMDVGNPTDTLMADNTQPLEEAKPLNVEIEAHNSKSESEDDKTLSKDFIQAVKLITNIIPISTTTNTTPVEISPTINTDDLISSSLSLDKSTVSEEMAREKEANIPLTSSISEDPLDLSTQETQHETKKLKINDLMVTESVVSNASINTKTDILETSIQKSIEEESISTEETRKSDIPTLNSIINCCSSEKIVSVEKHKEEKTEFVLTTSNSKNSPTKSIKIAKQENMEIQTTPTVSDDVKYLPKEELIKLINEIPIENEAVDQKNNKKNITKNVDTEKERNFQKLQQNKTICTEGTMEFKEPTSDQITICSSDLPLIDEHLKIEMELESATFNSEKPTTLLPDSKVTDSVPTHSDKTTEIQNTKVNLSESSQDNSILFIDDVPKTKLDTTLTMTLESTEFPVLEVKVEKEIVEEIFCDILLTKNTQSLLVKETIHKESIETDNFKSVDENKATIEDSIQVTDIISVPSNISNTVLEEPMMTETESFSLILDESEQKSDVVEKENRAPEDLQPISVEEKNKNEIHVENISLTTEASKENILKLVETVTSINITKTQANEIITTEKSVELTIALAEKIKQNESKQNSENKVVDSESAVVETEKQVDSQTTAEDSVSQNEQTLEIEEPGITSTEIFINSRESEIIFEQELLKKEKDSLPMNFNSTKSLNKSVESEIKKEVGMPSACIITNDENNVSNDKTLQNSAASKTENKKTVPEALVEKPLKIVETSKFMESLDVSTEDKLNIEVDASSSLIITDNTQSLSLEDTIQSKTESQLKNETIDSDSILINTPMMVQTKVTTDIPETKDIRTLSTVECIKQEKQVIVMSHVLNDLNKDLRETPIDVESPLKSNESSNILEMKTEKEKEHTSLTNLIPKDTKNALIEDTIKKETEFHAVSIINTDEEKVMTEISALVPENEQISSTVEITENKTGEKSKIELDNHNILSTKQSEKSCEGINQHEIQNQSNINLHDLEPTIVSTSTQLNIEIVTNIQKSPNKQTLSTQETLNSEKQISESFPIVDEIPHLEQTLKKETNVLSTTTNSKELPAKSKETINKEEKVISLNHTIPNVESTSRGEIIQKETENSTDNGLNESRTVEVNAPKNIDARLKIDVQNEETLISEKTVSETLTNSNESKKDIEKSMKTENDTVSMNLNSKKSPTLLEEAVKKEEKIISLSHNIPDTSRDEMTEKVIENATENELAYNLKSIDNQLKENIHNEKIVTKDIVGLENPTSKTEVSVLSETLLTENTKCTLVEETINNDSEIDKFKSGDENKTPISDSIQLAKQVTNIISLTSAINNTVLEEPIITQIEPLSLIPDETELTSDMVDEKNSVVLRASEDVRPIEENNQDEIISLNIESLKENSSKAVDTETSINITDKQTDEITTTEKSVEPTTALVEETNQSESTKHLEIKLVDPETIVIEITEQIDVQTVTDSQESQDEQTMTVKESMEPDSVTLLDSNESEIITREEPLSVNDDSSSLILNSKKLPATSIEDKTKMDVGNPTDTLMADNTQPLEEAKPLNVEIEAHNSKSESEDDKTLSKDFIQAVKLITNIIPISTTTNTTPVEISPTINTDDLISSSLSLDKSTVSEEMAIKKEENTESILTEKTESLKVEKPLNAEIATNKTKSEDDKTLSKDFIQAVKLITNIIPISTTTNTTPIEISPTINTDDLISSSLSLDKSTVSEEMAREKEANIPLTSSISEDPLDLSTQETQHETKKLKINDLMVTESVVSNASINTETDILETSIQKSIEEESISTEETKKSDIPVLHSITLSNDFIQTVKLITNIIPISTTTNTTQVKIPPTIHTDDLISSSLSLEKLTVSEEILKEEETNLGPILTEKSQSLKIEKPLKAEIVTNNTKSEDDKTLSKDFTQTVKLITNIIPISTTTNITPEEMPPTIKTDPVLSSLSLEKSTVSEEMAREEDANIPLTSTNNTKSEDDKILNLMESKDVAIEHKLEVNVEAESSSIKFDEAQTLSLEDKIQYETDPLAENKIVNSETPLVNTSTNIHTEGATDILDSKDVKNESSEECIRLEMQGTEEFSILDTTGRTSVEIPIEPVQVPLYVDASSISPEEITKKEEEQTPLEPTASENLRDISIQETIKKDTKSKVDNQVESENIFKESTEQTRSDTIVSNKILQDEQNILTEKPVKIENPFEFSDTNLNEEPIKTEIEHPPSKFNHDKSPDVQNTKEVKKVIPPITMMLEDVQSALIKKSNQNQLEIQLENEEVDYMNFLKKTLMNVNSESITDNLNLEDRKTIIENYIQSTVQITDIMPTPIVSNETPIKESPVTEKEPVSAVINIEESPDEPVQKKEEIPMIPRISEMKPMSVPTINQNEIHPENIPVKLEILKSNDLKTLNTGISTNILESHDNITTSIKKALDIPKTLDEKMDSNEEDSQLKIKLLDSELIVTNTLKQADVEIVEHSQISQFEPTESMKQIVEPENQLSDSIPISFEFDIISVKKTLETEAGPLPLTLNSEEEAVTNKIDANVEEEIPSTNIAFDDTQISSIEERKPIAKIPCLEHEQVEVKTDTSDSNDHNTLSTEESIQLEKKVTNTILVFNDPVPIEMPLKIETETASVTFISTELSSESLKNIEKLEEIVVQSESVDSKNEPVFLKKRIVYTSISSDTDTENDTQVSEDEKTMIMKETINSEKQISDTNSISNLCEEPLLEESLITEKKPLSKLENNPITQLKEENNKEIQVLHSAQLIKSSDKLVKNPVNKEIENQSVTSVLNDTNVGSINDVKLIGQEVTSEIPQNHTKSTEAHESSNVETEIVSDIPLMNVDEISIKVQELDNIKVESALPDNSQVILSGEPFENIKIISPETPILSFTAGNDSNKKVDTSTEVQISNDALSNAQETADTTILPLIKQNKMKIETMTPTMNKMSTDIEKPMNVENIESQNYSCCENSETVKLNSGSFSEYGESSKNFLSDIESKSKEKSYGIQKLEMSVQRMKTSDDDYFEKTVVQLEQTEKISIGKNAAEGENNTAIDDKLYTVNESDLNAIVCASSLQEALTLLDTKIKFKFKHNNKKSTSKGSSAIHKPNILTPTSSSSSKNANFTEARKFFKEMEKKSKK